MDLGRTELQIEVTWALQRGLVAVPVVGYPSQEVTSSPSAFQAWHADVKRSLAVTFSLVHPFARRPLFCSSNLVHRVMLDPEMMDGLARLDVDRINAEAAVLEAGQRGDQVYNDESLPTAQTNNALNRAGTTVPDGLPKKPAAAAAGARGGVRQQGNNPLFSGHDDEEKMSKSGGCGALTISASRFVEEEEGGGGQGQLQQSEYEEGEVKGKGVSGVGLSGLLLAPMGNVGVGEGGVLVDPTDEDAFLRFAEDESVDAEAKLRAMLGAFFSGESSEVDSG